MPKNAPKASKRAARKSVPESGPVKGTRRRHGNVEEFSPGIMPDVEQRQRPRQLEFRNEAQYNYAHLMFEKQLLFGTGPAGTGKTYIATSVGANLLNDRRISRFIACRPMVATENIGFLPGTEEEKCAPYFKVIRKTLELWLGASHVENMMKNGRIEFATLAHMRGETFDDAFVVLDEAQNTTPKQMELFLTRFGANCTMIVNGDSDQCDLVDRYGKPMPNGLDDAVMRMASVPNSAVFQFTSEDVVRSEMCKEIVKRYQVNRNS